VDRPPPPRPALIVHAGAWDVPDDEKDAHVEAVRAAVVEGWRVLGTGGSCVDAVRVAVTSLEDHPGVNAGVGSVLCREGWVEMDAAIMEGTDLEAGGVTGVRDHANPVRIAYEVLHSPHVLLAGAGASAFARSRGLEAVDPERLVVPRERERLAAWRRRRAAGRPGPADTVGAVAVDLAGRMAAASSTGGIVGKPSGRVGDAPIPGAGLFADDRSGAVAATGEGEAILRVGLARRAADLAREASAEDAAWIAVRELEDRVGGRGGLILIARDGSLGWAFNTRSMPLAYQDGETAAPVVRGVASR
jgi:beta-aspartyl-peptidase (threonine type)